MQYQIAGQNTRGSVYPRRKIAKIVIIGQMLTRN